MTHSEHVRLNGKVFLYRQKAPFVKSGHSVLGALEYDQAEDKVRCHECGDWFAHVGHHAAIAHGLSAREYKLRHGLGVKAALCGEGIRAASARAFKTKVGMLKHMGDAAARKRADTVRRRRKAAHQQIPRGFHETRNERRKCSAQLNSDILLLAKRLGRAPTQKELSDHGISGSSVRLVCGMSVSEVIRRAGLQPNRSGQTLQSYSDKFLLETLRDLRVMLGRTPFTSDLTRYSLPSQQTYANHFGSWTKALVAAGLNPTRMPTSQRSLVA